MRVTFAVNIRQEPGALVVVAGDAVERYVTADRQIADVIAEINDRSSLIVAAEHKGRTVVTPREATRRRHQSLAAGAIAALATAAIASPVLAPGFSPYAFPGFRPKREPREKTQHDHDALARAEAKRACRRERNRKLAGARS